MKKKLLSLLTLMLCVAGAAWGDKTLFDVDFTDETSETIGGSNDNAEFVAKTYDGYSMSFGVKNNKKITITNGEGLIFGGNNYADYQCLAIPLTLTANKKVTVVVTMKTEGKMRYGWVSGSLPETPSAGSANTYSTSATTNTIEYTPASTGNYVLYLGRSGSSDGSKTVKTIVITQEAASEAYTVTFDAGSNGTCTTGSLTEASAGAGVTLPAVTSNSGYAFNGWFTASSGGTKVGVAGETYHPTANNTLHAQYSAFADPTISIKASATDVTKGTSVTLTATVTGSPDPDINWYACDSEGTISGESLGTATTYSPSTATEGTFFFRAKATNNFNSSDHEALSNIITITVTDPNKYVDGNSYYIAVKETPVPDEQIICDDITMTFVNGKSGESFTAGVTDETIKGVNSNYVASISGSGDNNGWTARFVPTANGTLSVGVIINKNKTFSITNVTSFSYEGKNGANESVSATINSNSLKTDNNDNAKLYVVVTISVTTSTTYDFSVAGSKMGFYGFEFTPTVSGTITPSGWNTFSSNYALDLSTISGGTAYVASAASGSTVTMTPCTAKVEAGTGLMIKGTAGATFTISTTTDDATFSGSNLLKGLPNGGTVAAGANNYVFGWKDASYPGFFYVNSTEPTLDAGKAYLDASGLSKPTAARLSFIFEDDDVNGIETVESAKGLLDGEYFDLQGRRVAQPTKGLYILNGKKVVMK